MVHQSHEFRDAPQRGVERDLVQVFDDHVVPVAPKIAIEVLAGEEWVSLPGADAVHVDAIEVRALLRCPPGAAEEIDAVALLDDPAENLLQMELGAPRLRIQVVLPVEN